jgi:hypothetical protein
MIDVLKKNTAAAAAAPAPAPVVPEPGSESALSAMEGAELIE